jgi:hypothetical protein
MTKDDSPRVSLLRAKRLPSATKGRGKGSLSCLLSQGDSRVREDLVQERFRVR